jgi:hypothetical protein
MWHVWLSVKECRCVTLVSMLQPFSLQAWLASFPSLNPYSAAALAAAAPLRSLLMLQPLQQASPLVDWDVASRSCAVSAVQASPRTCNASLTTSLCRQPLCGCMLGLQSHATRYRKRW